MPVGNFSKFQNNQNFCLKDLHFRLFLKFENRQSRDFSADRSIPPIGYSAAFS